MGPFLASQTPKITSFFNSSQNDVQKKTEHIYSLRNILKRHRYPQMVCLQEVKINPKDEATKRALDKAANSNPGDMNGNEKAEPVYKAYFSLPRDKHNARGFGGKVHGVCTLLRTDILNISPQDSNSASDGKEVQTREVDWDLEGRALITEFKKWKLAVVNGYWVNGTMNPYRDPETGDVVGTRHDRKRAFHSSVLQEVKKYENKGWEVVLIGDMNVARDERDGYPGIRLGAEHVANRRDFNNKFFEDGEGLRGVDTWRLFWGDRRGYTYHGEREEEWGRSCDRVDLGIVTRGLVGEGERTGEKEGGPKEGGARVVGAEIFESVDDRGHSDHVPISVVLDVGNSGSKGGERHVIDS